MDLRISGIGAYGTYDRVKESVDLSMAGVGTYGTQDDRV